MDALPLPDAAVGVIITNCVVDLSTDKPAALAHLFRVPAPGGRIGLSDVVAEDDLIPDQRAERGSSVGACRSGVRCRVRCRGRPRQRLVPGRAAGPEGAGRAE